MIAQGVIPIDGKRLPTRLAAPTTLCRAGYLEQAAIDGMGNGFFLDDALDDDKLELYGFDGFDIEGCFDGGFE